MAFVRKTRGVPPGDHVVGAPEALRPVVGIEPAPGPLERFFGGDDGFRRLLALLALAGFAIGMLVL